MRRDVAAAVLALLVVGGCGGGTKHAALSLDGSPRLADDEGIVTAVDLTSITLDGARTYRVDDDLISFSSIDLSPVPLAFTESQYVQVGLDGKDVRWVGSVAVPLTTRPPRVVFSGKVRRVADRHIEFTNGTVFALARRVPAGRFTGSRVVVGLRPDRHAVTEVHAA